MRHRFHSLCPYFATFPETFVQKHLTSSQFEGVVFDPFCGRGTAVFESLLRERKGAGCDINPVAACVSGAKCDPPALPELHERLSLLEAKSRDSQATFNAGALEEFFGLCFAPETYRQILFLRETLDWQNDRTDRFVAALSLGALHGESHRSPHYFSNRMPRTISTNPAYSVRWWREKDYNPEVRDVFSILRRVSEFRFQSEPPLLKGRIELCDAREASAKFPNLHGQITDVITSPPYLDTTNYLEDQWLRLWFLGESAATRTKDDGRHYSIEKYSEFLKESWTGVAPLLADRVRIVVRIGGRKLPKEEALELLESSIKWATQKRVLIQDEGETSPVEHSQAHAFLGSKPSPTVEHDFCFLLD